MNKNTFNKAIADKIRDESFQSWISGRADAEIRQKWENWLLENPINNEIRDRALEIWTSAQFKNRRLPNVQAELQRLKNTLGLSDHPSIDTNVIIMHNRRFWKFSAAIVSVAALFLLYFVLNNYIPFFNSAGQYITASAGYGERTQLTLSDGSAVVLNGGSSLKYPQEFSTNERRKVYLQGEAYFNVSHKPSGAAKKFSVFTRHGEVEVLGTRFTVKAGEKLTEVVLISGSVKAVAKEKQESLDISASVIMKPGDYLRFKLGAEILSPKQEYNSLKTSWWKKQLVLKKTPVKEIIARLEDTYGIEVKLEDHSLIEKTISGSIENDSLDLIIEMLAKILGTRVSRSGNTVVFREPAS